MKKLCFFFLLTLSLLANSVFGQTYGIVIVPRAAVYASEDENAKKIAFVSEADLLNIKKSATTEDWLMITLSNGQNGYIAAGCVAFFEANSGESIEIDDIKYTLVSATQDIIQEEGTYWEDYINTPFLYNPITKKAYLIRSSAHSYSLSPRMIDIGAAKTILQYGAYEMGGSNNRTSLSVANNLLRLDWSSSGINQETGEDEDYEETIYMSVHQTSNGEFWALHSLAEGKSFDDIMEAAYIDSKPYWLRVKSEPQPTSDIAEMTLLLQDQKTNKTYYIYASPPKGHEHLFNKSYMQFEIWGGDGGYLMFTYYSGHLLIYAGGYSEETGNLEEMNIYWYALKMANGKIMATENVSERKTLQF